MKKVLVLSPEIPYPTFKGNQHRIDATIKILLDLNVEVAIAVLNSNQKNISSESIARDLKKHYKDIKIVEVRKNSNFVEKFDNKAVSGIYKKVKENLGNFLDEGEISNLDTCPIKFRHCVSNLIEKFQPTHILVNYAKLTRAIPKSYKGVKILDCHDIQTNILKEGIRTGIKKGEYNISKYLDDEINLLNFYDLVVSINKNETKQLVDLGVKPKVITIPGFNNVKNLYINNNVKKYDILFVGSASPFNVEGVMKFIAKVYPTVKRQIPNVKFAIAGDVSTCAAIKKVEDKTIERLGRVDSLEELYSSSKIVVSSIISGAGMKVKNIEALSFGMPIVATPFSMDGIDIEHNESACVQEDWILFAKDVVQLLKDEDKRVNLSRNAELLAKQVYSVEIAKNKYKAIIFNNLDFLSTNIISRNINSLVVLNESKSLEKLEPITKTRRIKGLIFSTDAVELMDYNIALAKSLNEINVYSEFIKMEYGCENRFYKNGFIVHAIRDKLTKERRAELKKEIIVNLENDKVVDFVYNGIDISDEINIYKQMFPQHFKKSINDVVIHGVLILEQIIKLMDKIKPDFLVGWNGNGPHFIFLMKIAAKIKGLPIYHVERGLLPKTFVVDSRGVNFKSSVAGSFLPLLNKEERKEARDYISKYRNNSDTIVNTQTKLDLNKDEILKKLNLDKDYIFFPMQIEGDSNIIINSPKYKRMEQVVSDLIDVAEKLNVYIICRPHPENNIAEVFGNIKESKNLIIDNSIHIHDMLKSSIANVVINSTVGLESILLGKPTIALGHSVYSAKNITFDAYSKEDILNSLVMIMTERYSHKLVESRTEALIAYLFSSQLLKLDCDPSENKLFLLNLLKKNGFEFYPELGKPKPPLSAQKYIQKLKDFELAIQKSSIINVYSELPENTVQYLNGSKKPFVTDELIVNSLSQKFKKDVVVHSDFTHINNQDGVKLIIVKSGQNIKYAQKNNLFVIDEFFELV